MPDSYSWIIWPQEPVTSANDEFLAQGARIRIRGAQLTIEAKGLTEIQARKIADQYVKALLESLPGAMTLITHEHFKKMVPPIIRSTLIREDRIRVQQALRKTRNSLLASGDVTLRRCYDYIQTAHEDTKNCLFHLYKAIEAIEKRFGGETKTISTLKKGKELKRLKRLANESSRDQRHSPKPTDLPAFPTGEEIQEAIKDAMAVLKAYEDHIS